MNAYIYLIESFVLLALIAASAFFSGSETALFSLSRARLLSFAAAGGSFGERAAASLMRGYERTLIILILGNMFVNTGISMLSDNLISQLGMRAWLSTIISVVFAIVVLLVFGEVSPKTIALANAEAVSIRVAPAVLLIGKLLSPLISLSNLICGLILTAVGRVKPNPLEPDEYASYIDIASGIGAFSPAETKLLKDAFRIRELPVAKIMTGRIDVPTVSKNMSAEAVEAVIVGRRWQYIPVVDKDIDDAEKILSAKKFAAMPPGTEAGWISGECLIPAVFIPENASAVQALEEMRRAGSTVALVADEYGGVAGFIERDDIYDELIDGLDDEHERPEDEIRQVGTNVWRLKGGVDIGELNDAVGCRLTDGPAAGPVNGFFIEKLDRLPKKGDKVRFGDALVTALKVARHRVVEAELVLPETSQREPER